MTIQNTDSFNEKCDKVLRYLAEISKSDNKVQILIHLNQLISDTRIEANDPVINFLSHHKKFIDIDMKSGYVQISSPGMAFISHSSFVEEQIKSDTERKLKWYETENAKQMFEDFPKTKARTIRSEWIAIFALIATVIGLMLQWKCNNSD